MRAIGSGNICVGRSPLTMVCSRLFEGLLRLVSAQGSNRQHERRSGPWSPRFITGSLSKLGGQVCQDGYRELFLAVLLIDARKLFLTDVGLDDQVDENLIRMKGRYALKATTTRPSSTIPLFAPPPF